MPPITPFLWFDDNGFLLHIHLSKFTYRVYGAIWRKHAWRARQGHDD